MPIEFRCPVCNQNLRVADQHVGQQAKCPQCGHLATVPAASVDSFAPSAVGASAGALAGAGAGEIGTADQWKLKTRAGDTFGPVTRVELDRWLSDGRIDAGSQVQQEGWSRWKPAAEVYPSLAGVSTNPYSSGNEFALSDGGQYSYVKPHRGTMILIMGILSITMCPLTGIAAWIMGSADLREMREGRMDRSGEGTTQAGYVCGIIGTVIFLLQLVVVVFYIVIVIGVIAAGAA
jgi:hypothetical protein